MSKLTQAEMQTYLDVAAVMFVSIGRDECVRMINKKGCEILGGDENSIVGKNWFDNFVLKKKVAVIRDVFNKIMVGKVSSVEHYENSVLTKNGEERIIAWHNAVIIDEDGKVLSTLSSGEDITERKKMETELKLKLSELQKINKVLFDREQKMIKLKEGIVSLNAQIRMLNS